MTPSRRLAGRASAHALAIALAALTLACSSEQSGGPTAITSGGQVDLAAAFSVMSAQTTSLVASLVPAGVAMLYTVPPVQPGACTYAAASQSFTCPPATSSGLTFSRTYYLYDAAGAAQSQSAKGTTASLRLVTTIQGTGPIAGPGLSGTATTDSRQEMTLSGLLTGRYMLDGTGSTSSSGSWTLNGMTVPFTLTESDRTVSVALPADGGSSSHPLSGSVTYDATSVLGSRGDMTTVQHMVLAFDGSGVGALTNTSNGTTTHCTVDLSNKVQPSCH